MFCLTELERPKQSLWQEQGVQMQRRPWVTSFEGDPEQPSYSLRFLSSLQLHKGDIKEDFYYA